MTRKTQTLATTGLSGLFAAFASGAVAQETMQIGFAVSMTGYLAPYDSPTVDGALIAIDDLNANGGAGGTYAIEPLVRDVRSETVQTTVVVQELIDAGADVIVVPCDDDPAIAGGMVAQEAGIPVFSTCATNASLPAAIGEFYFVNYVADTVQGTALAKYARELGLERAYLLISPETTYTGNLPEYFGDVFEANGGTVIGRGTYSFGQQDFSAEVTKIAGLDPQPDVVMTSAYEPDFPAFLRQLRGAGVTAQVMGSDGIDSPTTTSLAEISEGIIFSNAGNPDGSESLRNFFEKYEQVKGEPLTNSFAATGYDMMLVIDNAVRVAGSLDGQALRDAIEATEGLAVATGTISYAGRNQIPARSVSLNRIEGGRVVHVDTRLIDSADLPTPR